MPILRTLSFTGSARSLSDTALALSHLRAWHEAIEARFWLMAAQLSQAFLLSMEGDCGARAGVNG